MNSGDDINISSDAGRVGPDHALPDATIGRRAKGKENAVKGLAKRRFSRPTVERPEAGLDQRSISERGDEPGMAESAKKAGVRPKEVDAVASYDKLVAAMKKARPDSKIPESLKKVVSVSVRLFNEQGTARAVVVKEGGEKYLAFGDLEGRVTDVYRVKDKIGAGLFGKVHLVESLVTRKTDVMKRAHKIKKLKRKEAEELFQKAKKDLANEKEILTFLHAKAAEKGETLNVQEAPHRVFDVSKYQENEVVEGPADADLPRPGRETVGYIATHYQHGDFMHALQTVDALQDSGNKEVRKNRVSLGLQFVTGVRQCGDLGVHVGDLKTENVLIGEATGELTARVADFGGAATFKDRFEQCISHKKAYWSADVNYLNLSDLAILTSIVKKPSSNPAKALERFTMIAKRAEVYSAGLTVFEGLIGEKIDWKEAGESLDSWVERKAKGGREVESAPISERENYLYAEPQRTVQRFDLKGGLATLLKEAGYEEASAQELAEVIRDMTRDMKIHGVRGRISADQAEGRLRNIFDKYYSS